MKILLLPFLLLLTVNQLINAQPTPTRMKEVFSETVIATNGANLNSPWEITYGSDSYLWITESKTFLIRRILPTASYTSTPPAATIVLDLTSASWAAGIRKNYTVGAMVAGTATPDPQGGLMGIALHPEFSTNPAKRFVYVAYNRQYLGLNQSYAGSTVNGHLFLNNIVRFTYNTSTNVLESPVVLCDTIRGSNDHNSGRMIIATVSGTDYLFYAEGDMGAGQFSNINREEKAQLTQSYEGKILRFNLEPDGDADQGTVDYNQWIPNDNPFNNVAPVTGQSAVWSTGIRNNQGFAFANGILYGSSHGPFSDDEINIIERQKNYGHPLVIGYSADGNYNNAKAGPSTSILPLISSEATEAANIGVNYKDPLYSLFPAPAGNTSTPWSIQYIYTNQTYPGPPTSGQAQNLNQHWASIAPSGMDIYTNTKIPGWKNSLLLASLKKGYMMRVKLDNAGTSVIPTNGFDTVAVFNVQNRFRDLAIDPDGITFYGIVDRSGSTSGPTSTNPVSSVCPGCVIKYKFLGYADNGTSSTISTGIPIDAGLANTCAPGSSLTIDATNNNIWVPITGPNGDIVAEIKANGNNLGTVTSSFYVNTGSVREDMNYKPYSNRNINISLPGNPVISGNVSIRLYLTTGEYNSLRTYVNSQSQPSGISNITDVAIFKNTDACGSGIQNSATRLTTTAYTHGSYGYALQANITSFSSFYVGSNALTTLPLKLISFTAKPVNNNAVLQWTVNSTDKAANYSIERSYSNSAFETIGNASAKENTDQASFTFTDFGAGNNGSKIYYRIKALETNGTISYSNTVSVTFSQVTEPGINIYPNPVRNTVLITVNSINDEPAQLKVVDNTGRTVKQQAVVLKKGVNTFEVNMTSFTPGVYHADITGKSINKKIKFIKQ